MEKIYLIVHKYATNYSGDGKPVHQEEVLFATTDKAVAKKYIHEYSEQFLYDICIEKTNVTWFNPLYAGELFIKEVKLYNNINEIGNIKPTEYSQLLQSFHYSAIENKNKIDKFIAMSLDTDDDDNEDIKKLQSIKGV